MPPDLQVEVFTLPISQLGTLDRFQFVENLQKLEEN